MKSNRSALYIALVILAAVAAGYMVARQLKEGSPALQSGTALPTPRAIAPFAMTDHNGQTFSQIQLQGSPSLVFFGFTHCPDVCPTTLAIMAQLRREASLAGLRMIFVTVDPGRDDAATIKRYVDAFGGGITGLTGPDAALEPLLTGLGAARSLQPLPGGDYSVDHSATLFYLNAHGQLSAVFTPPFALPALRADLTSLINTDH
jgi:protein SCO1